MKSTLQKLQAKAQRGEITLLPPAAPQDLAELERIKGPLHDDWRQFYAFCNGWEEPEDFLTILSLKDILENELQWAEPRSWRVEGGWIFAEMAVYCLFWEVILNVASPSGYVIREANCLNGQYLTHSLAKCLERYAEMGFGDGWLGWRELRKMGDWS